MRGGFVLTVRNFWSDAKKNDRGEAGETLLAWVGMYHIIIKCDGRWGRECENTCTGTLRHNSRLLYSITVETTVLYCLTVYEYRTSSAWSGDKRKRG